MLSAGFPDNSCPAAQIKLPMRYGPKPEPTEQTPAEERDRRIKKSQVLSRKANERSLMLQETSRDRIDTSKELLSQSKERNDKAIQSMARIKAA